MEILWRKEKKLDDWINVYETVKAKNNRQKFGKPNYMQLYDVIKVPTFYLLDENKKIIAKQLSLDQFDDLVENKRKIR